MAGRKTFGIWKSDPGNGNGQQDSKRRFNPNLQTLSLYSEVLGKAMRFKVCSNALRTVEKKGGIDKFLVDASGSNLSANAIHYKKLIIKSLTADKEKN